MRKDSVLCKRSDCSLNLFCNYDAQRASTVEWYASFSSQHVHSNVRDWGSVGCRWDLRFLFSKDFFSTTEIEGCKKAVAVFFQKKKIIPCLETVDLCWFLTWRTLIWSQLAACSLPCLYIWHHLESAWSTSQFPFPLWRETAIDEWSNVWDMRWQIPAHTSGKFYSMGIQENCQRVAKHNWLCYNWTLEKNCPSAA